MYSNSRAAAILRMVNSKKKTGTQLCTKEEHEKNIVQNELQFLNDEVFDDDITDPNYYPFSEDESIVSDKNDNVGIEDTNCSSEESMVSERNENVDPIIQQMGEEVERQLNLERSFEIEVPSLNNEKQSETSTSRKQKRNQGKMYVTKTGNFMREKICKELESCRKKCKTRVTHGNQKDIFDAYWKLGSHKKRIEFLNRLIEVVPKKNQRLTAQRQRNRSVSNLYFLEIHGNRINVCQKCFLYTFDETEQIIKTIVKKKRNSNSGFIEVDIRRDPANKISPIKVNEIRNHINSFPLYESHYTRASSSQKYLASDLTVTKMYELYSESHENPVSYTKYRQIFLTMGIKMKKPKTDCCNKCEIFKMKINSAQDETEKEQQKLMQEKHHKEADDAYKAKAADKAIAKGVPSLKVLTFDLQKCLPTPNLETSVSFYKRLLWTYNLTVHDCISGQPICMMWHEGIAKRGGNEIASCILQYLKSIRNECRHIILYSDSCAGQNKNAFVSTMFSTFMQSESTIHTIDHKFLVPGHTHMECDVDHSLIERKKKNSHAQIHHPRDWYLFISALGTKNTFKVHEMDQSMFLNFSAALKEKFTWRKTNTTGEPFKWSSVRWLRYTKTFGIIQYKTSLVEEEDFKILNTKKRGIAKLTISDLNLAYNGPINISAAKKKDLVDMIDLINPNYHEFYLNLPSDNQQDIHPDLSEDSEEEA